VSTRPVGGKGPQASRQRPRRRALRSFRLDGDFPGQGHGAASVRCPMAGLRVGGYAGPRWPVKEDALLRAPDEGGGQGSPSRQSDRRPLGSPPDACVLLRNPWPEVSTLVSSDLTGGYLFETDPPKPGGHPSAAGVERPVSNLDSPQSSLFEWLARPQASGCVLGTPDALFMARRIYSLGVPS
jgi:hypothetical protein